MHRSLGGIKQISFLIGKCASWRQISLPMLPAAPVTRIVLSFNKRPISPRFILISSRPSKSQYGSHGLNASFRPHGPPPYQEPREASRRPARNNESNDHVLVGRSLYSGKGYHPSYFWGSDATSHQCPRSGNGKFRYAKVLFSATNVKKPMML